VPYPAPLRPANPGCALSETPCVHVERLSQRAEEKFGTRRDDMALL